MSQKITVVDSPMGSGKTSAAIRMMNENPGHQYLFVTPYLSECERIIKACAKLRFKDPDTWDQELGACNKTQHITELLRRGENVVTSHVLFSMFTDEIKTILREQHYTLILDETLSVIDKVGLTKNDWQTLHDTGRVEVDGNNLIRAVNYDYKKGDMYFPLKDALKNHEVYKYSEHVILKILKIDTFELFDSVFILTYMFESQLQCALFNVLGYEYECIGVRKDGDQFDFTDNPDEYYNPLKGIKNKIEIMDYGKNNKIGDKKNALSVNWYKTDLATTEKLKHGQMRRKMCNMVKKGFANGKRVSKESIMWTVFLDSASELSSDIFDEGNLVSCTTRAENKWMNKTNLLYLVNRFCDPNLMNYFSDKHVKINQDDFALSEMVQWIWRSAIRNGQKIKIYIPSSRMRKLLKKWLEKVS